MTSAQNEVSSNVLPTGAKDSKFTSAMNSPRGLIKQSSLATLGVNDTRSPMKRVTMLTPPPMARGSMAPSTMPPGSMARGSMAPSTTPPGSMARGSMAPSTMPRNSLAPSTMPRGSMAAQGLKLDAKASIHIPLGGLESSNTSLRDPGTSTLMESQTRIKVSAPVSPSQISPTRT